MVAMHDCEEYWDIFSKNSQAQSLKLNVTSTSFLSKNYLGHSHTPYQVQKMQRAKN